MLKNLTSARIGKTCLLIYLVSQIFFLINIQFPRGQNFDEFHYVPSAKQYLEFKENRNYEHPPLGKELMAVGIGIWGDRPIGWRFMSTVFGALTLVGIYLWSLALFRDEKLAIWTALLTGCNQLLYVQARIGMLDTFMFAFIAFAMASFTAAWNSGLPPRTLRRLFLFTGIMLGLATATKWFGVIPWALCLGLIGIVRIFQSWGVSFEKREGNLGAPADRQLQQDWFHPELWKGIKTAELALYFLAVPLLVYFSTFLPAVFQKETPHSLWDVLVGMQARMWDGQSRVVDSHPYMSRWTDWAIIKRPIWYAFDKEGPAGQFVRGVILIGNPLIMWGGLGALLFCAYDWLKERRRDAMLILLAYSAFYLSWAVIPRKVSFYYYYYPAGMTLSLAIAYVIHRLGEVSRAPVAKVARYCFLGVAMALFVYFFPILAALKIPASSYINYMWLRSWI